jgi:hypothetical protein
MPPQNHGPPTRRPITGLLHSRDDGASIRPLRHCPPPPPSRGDSSSPAAGYGDDHEHRRGQGARLAASASRLPAFHLPITGWAAVMRASLCRHGVEQMRADADEAARKCAEAGIVAPVATLLQGIARILCGDLDGGDALLEETLSDGQEIAAPIFSPIRCANDRWWRWRAANGTGPSPMPGKHARCCAGPGVRTYVLLPWSVRC